MAFERIAYTPKGREFNTAASSEFLDLYNDAVESQLERSRERIPSKTLAPSSFRCPRIQFFRLRGTKPDTDTKVDTNLEFTSFLGTAIHEEVQQTLSKRLGSDWLDVADWLADHDIPADVTKSPNGLETLVKLNEIPVKFAVDGLMRLDGIPTLLEIKTAEYDAFRSLDCVRQKHVDQIRCYLTFLGLDRAMVLYIERRFGGAKCFELAASEGIRMDVMRQIYSVLDCAKNEIAPKPLPKGDALCNYCIYQNTCEKWGR